MSEKYNLKDLEESNIDKRKNQTEIFKVKLVGGEYSKKKEDIGKYEHGIEINGLWFVLFRYRQQFNHKYRVAIQKMLVDPDLIKLWVMIEEKGEFDENLYKNLDDKNKNWLIKALRWFNIKIPSGLIIAMTQYAKPLYTRLQILESEVLAGNVNERILEEFEDVLDKLVESHNLKSNTRTFMLKRLKNTINNIKVIKKD